MALDGTVLLTGHRLLSVDLDDTTRKALLDQGECVRTQWWQHVRSALHHLLHAMRKSSVVLSPRMFHSIFFPKISFSVTFICPCVASRLFSSILIYPPFSHLSSLFFPHFPSFSSLSFLFSSFLCPLFSPLFSFLALSP